LKGLILKRTIAKGCTFCSERKRLARNEQQKGGLHKPLDLPIKLGDRRELSGGKKGMPSRAGLQTRMRKREEEKIGTKKEESQGEDYLVARP